MARERFRTGHRAMRPSHHARRHQSTSSGEGQLLVQSTAATGVLVETSADRADGDVADAEAAIDRLGNGTIYEDDSSGRASGSAPACLVSAGPGRPRHLQRLPGPLPKDGQRLPAFEGHMRAEEDAVMDVPSVTFPFTTSRVRPVSVEA